MKKPSELLSGLVLNFRYKDMSNCTCLLQTQYIDIIVSEFGRLVFIFLYLDNFVAKISEVS